MRLWSLHPRHLDRSGLLAVWREGLLARAVLRGRTRGYRHHPQLARFRKTRNPVAALNRFLFEIASEARQRGYSFDAKKFRGIRGRRALISVTKGQIEFERGHLLRKLRARDSGRARDFVKLKRIEAHPVFRIVPGKIEEWERG